MEYLSGHTAYVLNIPHLSVHRVFGVENERQAITKNNVFFPILFLFFTFLKLNIFNLSKVSYLILA